MNISRTLAAPTAVCALLLSAVTLSAGTAAHGAKATTPQIAFEEVTTQCSELTMDGEAQTQCQASFTVAASQVKSGYKVIVIQAPRGSLMKRTVGRFTAKQSTASRRFSDEVCSFGATDEPTKLKFYAVVKDADGEKLLKTKPNTLC